MSNSEKTWWYPFLNLFGRGWLMARLWAYHQILSGDLRRMGLSGSSFLCHYPLCGTPDQIPFSEPSLCSYAFNFSWEPDSCHGGCHGCSLLYTEWICDECHFTRFLLGVVHSDYHHVERLDFLTLNWPWQSNQSELLDLVEHFSRLEGESSKVIIAILFELSRQNLWHVVRLLPDWVVIANSSACVIELMRNPIVSLHVVGFKCWMYDSHACDWCFGFPLLNVIYSETNFLSHELFFKYMNIFL